MRRGLRRLPRAATSTHPRLLVSATVPLRSNPGASAPTPAAKDAASSPTDKKAYGTHAQLTAAIKGGEVDAAWGAYQELVAEHFADKWSVSKLVAMLGRAGEIGLVRKVWSAIVSGDVHGAQGRCELDGHFCSTFVTAFGALGEMGAATKVIDEARRLGVLNTRVCNSYLSACTRAGGARSERALALLGRMQADGIPIDPFTCSLGVGIYGRAGRIDEAKRLLELSDPAADAIAFSAYITAASKAGETHLALATLREMEESGPAPHTHTYNSVLQALAWSDGSAGGGLDRVSEALSVRERMWRRGLEGDAITRTTLLKIFGDSSLADSVVADLAVEEGRAAADGAHPLGVPDGEAPPHLVTDLRGLTRPAASVMLQSELERAASLLDETGADTSGDWVVITGSLGRRPRSADDAQRTTFQTAVGFLAASGIRYRQLGVSRDAMPGAQLLISAAEISRVAAEASQQARRQRVRKGRLVQLVLVASGLAAVAVVPRLLSPDGAAGG